MLYIHTKSRFCMDDFSNMNVAPLGLLLNLGLKRTSLMSKNMKNMDMIEFSWVENIDFLPMIGLSCTRFRCFFTQC